MDIVVGLGNPGRRYQHTRHNVGFDVIDILARRHGISLRPRVAGVLCGEGRIGEGAVLLVKPQTFMNASGEVVAPLVRTYLHAGEILIVVHDDIDLPLGKIKVKRRGGDAGHLGVRSLITCLGYDTFLRVRVGIGRPPRKEDIVAYVLSRFSAEEAAVREAVLIQAAEQVEALLAEKPRHSS